MWLGIGLPANGMREHWMLCGMCAGPCAVEIFERDLLGPASEAGCDWHLDRAIAKWVDTGQWTLDRLGDRALQDGPQSNRKSLNPQAPSPSLTHNPSAISFPPKTLLRPPFPFSHSIWTVSQEGLFRSLISTALARQASVTTHNSHLFSSHQHPRGNLLLCSSRPQRSRRPSQTLRVAALLPPPRDPVDQLAVPV
ncbi:hypothetical protein N656DRAFT_501430 [Canariomyces notabilis]|uniref:Uncharacterized protein n=1 Tax=Canariomyces notabilis TaxID=2074819 RepID=A0AAN6TK43_9PEZI|nr:hypothetical protein N656DRAFT_501430 [Canariomyces arenarius]